MSIICLSKLTEKRILLEERKGMIGSYIKPNFTLKGVERGDSFEEEATLVGYHNQ